MFDARAFAPALLLVAGGSVASAATTVRFVDFQSRSAGTYTQSLANQDFTNVGWSNGLNEGRGKIVAYSNGGKVLQAKFPAGGYSTSSGFQFNPPYAGRDEYYMDYRIKFEGNFDWKKGGKIPGLGGGTNPTGGTYSASGFSARLMWRENGRGVIYLYWNEQNTRGNPSGQQYGQDFDLGLTFARDTSYYITQRVKLNTAGQRNGILQVWINGCLLYTSDAADDM
jgi:hypothetical protein